MLLLPRAELEELVQTKDSPLANFRSRRYVEDDEHFIFP